MQLGLKPFDLLTDLELLDERAISCYVLLCEIVEQPAALSYHLEESALSVVVLGVALKMWSEGVDRGGEDRDLDFGRTGVVSGLAELGRKLRLLVFGNWHYLER